MALRPTRPNSQALSPAQSRVDQLAAQRAASDGVFMREVDEAVRQDEMVSMAKRYGLPLIGAALLGLLALAGYLWWDHRGEARIGEDGEKFSMALDRVEAAHLDSADQELATLVTDSGDGTTAVAKLMRGGIALEQGKKDEAAKLFGEVSGDAGAPRPFRDLATIRQVATTFDGLPPQTVVDRLKPLAIPGNPWFGNAGELLGIAYLKQNKPALAGPLFAAIAKDKDTPESLRARARQLAGLLGVDSIDDPEKTAAAVGTPQ